MDISFSKADIQKICERQSVMRRKLGLASARKLQRRLDDLSAAETLADVTAGRPHPLTGDRSKQFAIDLHGACRLVFESADEPVPEQEDGTTAWHRVTKIKIVFIGDYHD